MDDDQTQEARPRRALAICMLDWHLSNLSKAPSRLLSQLFLLELHLAGRQLHGSGSGDIAETKFSALI